MDNYIEAVIIEREAVLQRDLVASLRGSPNIHVIATVGSAEHGYREVGSQLPDVVLVGTTLDDAPGMTAATELHHRFPGMSIIVISRHDSDDELFAAIRTGAAAYVVQNGADRRLGEVVKRTARGEYPIDQQLLARPAVATRVFKKFRVGTSAVHTRPTGFPLTEREYEVLDGIRKGMTNAEVGVSLNISDQTVKNHVTAILRKLAVTSRTQAVLEAIRRGWLPLDDHIAEPASRR